jgi:hypothetical protein
VYQAVLSLAAKTGFTFSGVPADSFTYSGAIVGNAAGNGAAITVTITFPATAAPDADTTVNALALTSLVTAPVRDAAPVTAAIDTAQYTGTIAWQKGDGSSFSGNFAAATVYQAVLSLAAKTGYTFTGVPADSFTYSGATVTNPAGDSSAITVTIAFPATEGSAAIIIGFNDEGSGAFSDETFSLSQGVSDSKIITLVGNWSSQEWRVDGLVKGSGTTFTVSVADYTQGTHTLRVTVWDTNGVPWSGALQFSVSIVFGDGAISLGFNDEGSGAFSDETFTLSQGVPDSKIITLVGNWSSQEWRVDGLVKGSGATFTVNAADYTLGTHTLRVTVRNMNGVPWSEALQFTITN